MHEHELSELRAGVYTSESPPLWVNGFGSGSEF
jgi:hypothetical protein